MSRKFLTPVGLPSGATLPVVVGPAGALFHKSDENAVYLSDGTNWTLPQSGYTSVIKHQVKLGESIAKGQAVYVSSANGTNMIVSKASNASEATSSKTMGLLETGGATNAFVNVITEGLLAGLNTSSASAGDPVWLGTSGNLIYGLASKPSAPAHLVFIGVVTRVHAVQGEIFVRPQNGFETTELHDFSGTPATDGQVPTWDASLGMYVPSDVSGGGGGGVTVSETPPTGVPEGWIWYDTTSGISYIFYDSFWVELSPAVAGPAGEENFNSFMLMGA